MRKKPILIIISIFLLVLLVLGYVTWHENDKKASTNSVSTRNVIKQVGIVKTPSSNSSNSENTPEPDKSPNGTSLQHSESSDTNGKAAANTPQNEWTTSVSGNITLEQPTAGTTITNGTEIVGSTKAATTVNYRLSDNSTGVLTLGTLNVVNGKFSGILYFTPKSNKGQLDVFTSNDRGVELDEIQIGINF